jgi:SAM-dependent methyltransferase
MPKHPRYQDYVIRDGQLVGDFEQMYRDHDDPWEQLVVERFMSDKAVALNLLARLKAEDGVTRVVDLGCGLGAFTSRIADLGLQVTGLDVSPTAIAKAKERHAGIAFAVGSIDDHALIKRLAPDVIVMAEITWYVLDHLRSFIEFLGNDLPNTHLLHLLTTYPSGSQRYGLDFFTTLDEIRAFFGFEYQEYGSAYRDGDARTWFLGRPIRRG